MDTRILEPVLVTGASGYLASRLVPALFTQCRDVRLLSRRKPSFRKAKYFAGSPDGDQRVLREATAGVRTIFHLAGQTSVAAAKRDPDGDHNANVVSMLRLVGTVANAAPPPALIFAGTVTQAGIPPGDTLDENVPDRPITVYDVHKLAAEKHLELASSNGVVRGVSLRLANIFGPGTPSAAADRGVLNVMIRRASHGEPLTVFGSGNQMRDYTYVDDVVEAFIKAATHAQALCGKHFVIGSGQGRTIAEIILTVARHAGTRTGRRIEVVRAPHPAHQDEIDGRSYAVNATAFMNATGWRPAVALEDGIDRTLEWIAERAHA